jgi:hypothetical protein
MKPGTSRACSASWLPGRHDVNAGGHGLAGFHEYTNDHRGDPRMFKVHILRDNELNDGWLSHKVTA